MKDIAIRPLTIKDLKRMCNLIETRDDIDPKDAEKRLRLVEWVAFKNPFANGEPTYFVADDGRKIVAHLGRMPMEFMINGRICKGYFVHDLYVDPEYRANGQGFFVCMSLYKAIETNSDSFCCMVWTAHLNLELQRLRGYHELGGDRYYKFFNPYEKMTKVIKQNQMAKLTGFILKIVLRFADAILINLIPAGVKVTKTDKFDSRFDKLDPDTFSKIGICSHKTRKYLNWRFTGKPFGNMEVLVAEKSKGILGFAVVSVENDGGYLQGVLVDIMAHPDDARTISSLFKAAVKYFRRKKVDWIRCCLTDKRFARILKRFLFFKDVLYKEPVMLANLDKCDVSKLLIDINRWHLTYGASDDLMLDVLHEGNLTPRSRYPSRISGL